MADNDSGRTDGAPPRHIHIEQNKTGWLVWLLLALGLLALLFGLISWMHRGADTTTTTTTTTSTNTVVAETPSASRSAALAGTSTLGDYLAGSQPTPRTFTFDTLNFDTARSVIRPSDEGDVETVADVLKKYPAARIRIAGYADTRGSAASNVALGKARAESVKAALVARGIDAGRIATASGGDADPIATNATASGRAGNRRTELVVTQR